MPSSPLLQLVPLGDGMCYDDVTADKIAIAMNSTLNNEFVFISILWLNIYYSNPVPSQWLLMYSAAVITGIFELVKSLPLRVIIASALVLTAV